jgi:ribosomal protein S18 acetylase RimI-like enzyme
MGDWGWVGALGVLPEWRRRGLGLALLRESFRRIHATGETVVALGVDSQNPTGATRLYERAGMRALWRADVWEKELRPDAS